MMHSMTGFGSAENATDSVVARVEASSINRKQSEIIIQIPRQYSEIEPVLKKLALSKISRGRLQLNIQIEPLVNEQGLLALDTQKVASMKSELERLNFELGLSLELTSSEVFKIPGVFVDQAGEISLDQVEAAVMPALEEAFSSLLNMRSKEGEHLKADVIARLDLIQQQVIAIRAHAPSVVERYRQNLHQKLNDNISEGFNLDFSDERLLKEIAIFAERCDISEEVTRLDSHMEQFLNYSNEDKPVGRSLDFLCQEINRELNTIGSKANDAELAQHVVTAKTELEKIREQVQNIE